MRSIFLLALGLIAAYPSTVASAKGREYSLREECTRDRCVYYKGSTRVFSVEKEESTNRLVVRDARRKPVAKVTDEDGYLRVKETRR